MFEKHKKEAPFFTGITRGVGGAGFGKARAAGPSGSSTKATGGTIIPAAQSGNGYTYHVFLYPNVDNFVASSPLTADVLIVAGGGSGGFSYYAGGGGAGGVVYGPNVPVTSGTYSVTVGQGGLVPAATGEIGSKGSPSWFGQIGISTVTALGGGGGSGGSVVEGAGNQGGSSGGVDGYGGTAQPVLPQPVPVAYTAYGNAGGLGGSASRYTGGGGGGAGSTGYNAPTGPTPQPAPIGPYSGSVVGGTGGDGRAFPAFSAPIIAPAIPTTDIPNAPYAAGGGAIGGPVPTRTAWTTVVGPTGLFAGGGGGSSYYTAMNPAQPNWRPVGGTGGGADGAGTAGAPATNDSGGPAPAPTVRVDEALSSINYTGGGGGGGNYGGAGNTGSPGAHGIVLIRYQ